MHTSKNLKILKYLVIFDMKEIVFPLNSHAVPVSGVARILVSEICFSNTQIPYKRVNSISKKSVLSMDKALLIVI